MANRPGPVSSAQRMASLAVLGLLCAVLAWILVARTRLNPAVEVALRAPALKAQAAVAPAAGLGPEAATTDATTDATTGATAGVTTGATAAPGAKTTILASLLPQTLAGIQPQTQAEAFTPATLSDKIDGKAELYLAAGFAAMACRSYQAQGARVDVYLYRMKTPDAAFAVFSGQRRPGAAQSSLAKNAYLTENALFLISGSDYLEVIADKAGVRPVLETLARSVLAAMGSGAASADQKPASAAVQPADLFPKAGLKADSIRLAVADAFGCQGLTNIYTAEYDASQTSAGGGATAFLTRRKTAAEAQKLAQLFQRFLTDNGYVAKPAPGAPAGAVVLAMDGSVEILLLRGPILAGVHDAADLAVALKLAAALDSALKAQGLEK